MKGPRYQSMHEQITDALSFSFKWNSGSETTKAGTLYVVLRWGGMRLSFCLLWSYILLFTVKQKAKPSANDSSLREEDGHHVYRDGAIRGLPITTVTNQRWYIYYIANQGNKVLVSKHRMQLICRKRKSSMFSHNQKKRTRSRVIICQLEQIHVNVALCLLYV